MQHAAIDSNSTAPMLTGTSFSSVSFFSSSLPYYQYKANAIPHSALGLDFSVPKEHFSFIANHRCRQIGVNALCLGAGNPLPWKAGIVNLRDKYFFKPVPPISDRWRVALGFAGLRETALAHA